MFTVDHIMPLCAKGSNHWRNLVGACGACNNDRNKKWEFVRLIPLENNLLTIDS